VVAAADVDDLHTDVVHDAVKAHGTLGVGRVGGVGVGEKVGVVGNELLSAGWRVSHGDWVVVRR
jgi:hypothetical protein